MEWNGNGMEWNRMVSVRRFMGKTVVETIDKIEDKQGKMVKEKVCNHEVRSGG